MSTVFSTQFFKWNTFASGLAGSFLVPVGFVVVVRDISATLQPSGSAQFLEGQEAAGAVFWEEFAPASSDPMFVQFHGRVVLNAGETLQVAYSGAGQTTGIASGYVLNL